MHDGWAIITRYLAPAENRFVLDIATFVHNEDGSWCHDDERHENVLVDASGLPGPFRAHGVAATVAASFGIERLPSGLVAVTGHRLA